VVASIQSVSMKRVTIVEVEVLLSHGTTHSFQNGQMTQYEAEVLHMVVVVVAFVSVFVSVSLVVIVIVVVSCARTNSSSRWQFWTGHMSTGGGHDLGHPHARLLALGVDGVDGVPAHGQLPYPAHLDVTMHATLHPLQSATMFIACSAIISASMTALM